MIVVEVCPVGSMAQNQHAGEGAEGWGSDGLAKASGVCLEQTVLGLACVPRAPQTPDSQANAYLLHFDVCSKGSENACQVAVC